MNILSMDKTKLRLFVSLAFVCMGARICADQALPAWYQEGAVAQWHYRVAINLPAASAISSTVQLNVDFGVLLNQLGIDSAASIVANNSVRIVRSNGVLAATQEYTDIVFSGSLDASNNNRGEVLFLLEDLPASGSYFLYFDIVANGFKPASPAAALNGNFEHSQGSTPTGWTQSSINAGGAQNNEVHQSTATTMVNVTGGCSTGAANNVDNSPNNNAGVATGQSWHLLGFRDNCEDGNGNERIQLSKNIAIPAGAAAGTLDFYFQVQGWDGIQSNSNYDWFVFLVNGVAVNHTNLNINNTPTPRLRIDTNRLGRSRYGKTIRDHGWKQASLDLTPYQGTNITFRIESRHSSSDNAYRTWIKLDDLTWSIQSASLGMPEGFGINIIAPYDTAVSATSIYTATQTLNITTVVDATPQNITASVYDTFGAQVASGILLFDDGSHGDIASGDNIYTNDGSVGSEPTYTIQGTDAGGSSWLIRVVALDASLSGLGATDGLIHINAAASSPEIQQNYFNIEEQLFSVTLAQLEIQKTIRTDSDPINGTSNPKTIPGAIINYELLVENRGPDGSDTDSIEINEALPTNVSLCVTSACSGTADPLSFNDLGSPEPTNLNFNYATDVSYSTDGATFNTGTSPDANGFDNQISHIRIKPTGAMAAPGAGGDPSFILRYVIRLD